MAEKGGEAEEGNLAAWVILKSQCLCIELASLKLSVHYVKRYKSLGHSQPPARNCQCLHL